VKRTSNRAAKSGTKKSLTKTFTYYIPAPPHRRTGYREVEFDKIMQGILTSGFELLDLKTQAVSTRDQAGLFIVATVKAKDSRTYALDEALDLHEKFKLAHAHSSPDIVLEDEGDE
jgi:hypothetical protein